MAGTRRSPGGPGSTCRKVEADDLRVVESVGGGGGTEFGVPSNITKLDRRKVTKADAERLASLVEAAWVIFDRVAERSPAELRKGPRGGGRDRDKMIGHVIEADHAYAREIGVHMHEPSFADRAAVEAERAAVLDALRQPSDGSPMADRKWTASLRRPPDRLARPRPRLGDGRPRGQGTVIGSATVAPTPGSIQTP